MSKTDLPLPVFYAKTLETLLPIFDDTLPLSDQSTQSRLNEALDDLHLIARMVTSLGVFSDNEGVDELGDGEIVFMSIGWVIGETESKAGLGGRDDRLKALKRSENAYNMFISLLSTYKVISPSDQAESSSMAGQSGLPRDPAKRREMKIAQYKREKELRQQISAQSRNQSDTSSNPLVFLLSLLPPPSATSRHDTNGQNSTSVNHDEADQRSVSLLILELLYTITQSSLASIKMELDLLASAPPDPEPGKIPDDARREDKAGDIDTTWRLDRAPPGTVQPRQLISGGGRVLRPFTILPSTKQLSDRERLRGEVFRSGHRLPTMTIDEYLAEEEARGNIITGGGQASADQPTSSELLQLATEEDGTMEADEKDEQKRLKDENWARYTEENAKGAGNTMNRG